MTQMLIFDLSMDPNKFYLMKPIRGQGSQLFTVFLVLYYKTEEAHSFNIDRHDFPGLMKAQLKLVIMY